MCEENEKVKADKDLFSTAISSCGVISFRDRPLLIPSIIDTMWLEVNSKNLLHQES